MYLDHLSLIWQEVGHRFQDDLRSGSEGTWISQRRGAESTRHFNGKTISPPVPTLFERKRQF